VFRVTRRLKRLYDGFKSFPVFTRTWLGLTFAITAAVTLDVIPVHQIVLDWHRVFNTYPTRHHQSIELWRVLTSFCYCGAPLTEFYSLFLLLTISAHSNGYEKNPFPAGSGNRSADTIFAIVFCAVCLLITHPIPGYFFGPKYELYPILTRNLTGVLIYLWSKRNPRAMIRLNFFPMEGQYLPFAHIGLALFMDNRLHELLHGFVVAHVYYYLVAIAPAVLGRPILQAPRILAELIGEGDNIIPEPEYEPQGRNRMSDFIARDGATPAHIAAKLGNLPLLQELAGTVTSAGGRGHRRRVLAASDHNGWQPLHEACRGGHTEIVRYLVVEQGEFVDVNATTNGGQSPLSLALQNHGEDHPVTQLLREAMDADNSDDQEGSDDSQSSH